MDENSAKGIQNLKDVTAAYIQTVYTDMGNKNKELIQSLNEESSQFAKHMKQQIREEKGKHEDEDDGGRGDDKGRKDGRSTLTNFKDNIVWQLRDGITKDEYLQWKRVVEVHLESVGKWSSADKVLMKIRLIKTEVTEKIYNNKIAETFDEDLDEELKFWEGKFKSKSKELYMFLLPKLNVDLSSTVNSVEEMNTTTYRWWTQAQHSHRDSSLEAHWKYVWNPDLFDADLQ